MMIETGFFIFFTTLFSDVLGQEAAFLKNPPPPPPPKKTYIFILSVIHAYFTFYIKLHFPFPAIHFFGVLSADVVLKTIGYERRKFMRSLSLIS